MGMKKNKVHETIEEGVVYVGAYMNRRKNGKGKVGTTEKDIKRRESVIRAKYGKDYRMLACLVIYNTTKNRLEHIESGVKMILEEKYVHIGNDHFAFSMQNKKISYCLFMVEALTAAKNICDQYGWNYEIRFFKIFQKTLDNRNNA